MERGTDREFEALRERWAELERERTLADRLAFGAALLGTGVVLVLLTVPAEACDHGDGVAGTVCTTVENAPAVEATVTLLGAAALVGGAWLCSSVVAETR